MIELRTVELMIENYQLSQTKSNKTELKKIANILSSLDLLNSYARTASDKERLLLAHARYKGGIK